MIYLEEELTKALINEMSPLLIEHWKEVAVNQDTVKLDPDYDKYLLLQQLGLLKVFTTRNYDNQLIGYYITLVAPHIHYKKNLFAVNDITFVSAKYRQGAVGIKLIKFAEQRLKEIGVDVVTLHIKTQHDFSPIVTRLGYSCVESVYSKYIGK